MSLNRMELDTELTLDFSFGSSFSSIMKSRYVIFSLFSLHSICSAPIEISLDEYEDLIQIKGKEAISWFNSSWVNCVSASDMMHSVFWKRDLIWGSKSVSVIIA